MLAWYNWADNLLATMRLMGKTHRKQSGERK